MAAERHRRLLLLRMGSESEPDVPAFPDPRCFIGSSSVPSLVNVKDVHTVTVTIIAVILWLWNY